MKRILIFLFILLLGCNHRERIHVSGIINNGEGKGLKIQQLESDRLSDLDSLVIHKNRSFKFSVKLHSPELLILRNDEGAIINLLATPGESIRIHSDYENFGRDYEVTGSPGSEKIRELVIRLGETRHALDSLFEIITGPEIREEEQMRLMQREYQQTLIDQKRYTIRFLIENSRSLSSVYALYQKLYDNLSVMDMENDLQYFKFIADSMKTYHPNSSLTLSLLEDIAIRERAFEGQAVLDELLSRAEEQGILDISLPDPKGDTIRLSELQGKVVMLAFWSSGNEQSVKALVSLQGTYKKYHNKGFEVYAISLDDNRERWTSTIRFNEFNWINVSELAFPDSRTDKLYNISRLPTVFLINREGNLVTRDLYGRNLEIWLDNLL
ncbi:MAG: AhpC/TSA family protein [Bacteroidales bacterium]|nr:AhpC/TSA family protein [Bacteroidales bacterium]